MLPPRSLRSARSLRRARHEGSSQPDSPGPFVTASASSGLLREQWLGSHLRERGGQAMPSKRLVTEPFSKTSRIVCASSGAMERTVRFSKRFSAGIGPNHLLAKIAGLLLAAIAVQLIADSVMGFIAEGA